MCGIVGYVGPQRAQDVVIDGLRRLEYRGYDSAGVAVVHDGQLAVAKRSGKLANLEKVLADTPLPAGAHRHRAHPLGHPRPAQRRQRPPAHRRCPPDRAGAQRDHRELRRAAGPDRGRRPRLPLRDRHRDRGAPGRAAGAVGRRPARSRCSGCASSSTARSRSSRSTPRTPTGWWPPAATARWSSASARARTSSARTSRRSSSTPVRRSSSGRTRSSPSPATR